MQNLRFGAIGNNAVHLCIDMQSIFSKDSPWAIPRLERILPNICLLTEAYSSRTIFTRFIPAQSPEFAGGNWVRYYKHWESMTLNNICHTALEIVPQLKKYVPPALVVDKTVYSPWFTNELKSFLETDKIDTLLISGAETDVCVLATVLGAVDIGYRTIIVTDAICSSSNASHKALQYFYSERLAFQIETASTTEVLKSC